MPLWVFSDPTSSPRRLKDGEEWHPSEAGWVKVTMSLNVPNAGSIELINNSDSPEKRESWAHAGSHIARTCACKLTTGEPRCNNSISLPRFFGRGFFIYTSKFLVSQLFHVLDLQISPRLPISKEIPQISCEAVKLCLFLFGTESSLPTLQIPLRIYTPGCNRGEAFVWDVIIVCDCY